ncbi:MAG: Rrf2 family transcriptional regulator [Nitrospira sp.]|jgi:Rrf2 family protein|nr:Rrf2 family transcriptional regulator [Nitrospira sp.]
MRVSHRTTYGILAAVDLAMNGSSEPIQARSIAKRQSIPVRFLEQVLHAMKKAGLVDSIRGAQGGYLLLKNPAELSVADILEALDGPVLHGGGLDGHVPQKRESRQHLLLGQVWEQVEQAERAVLEAITVEQLVERQRALDQQQNPMYHI